MVNLNTGEIIQDGTQALVVIEGRALSVLPSDTQVDEGLRRAGYLATRIAELIEQKHLYQVIGKRKHVLVEAWETIIALDNATPNVDALDTVEENGLLVAYRANVSIWKDGAQVSNGIMECGLEDEFVTQRATGRGKNRAAQSAAQTWALAKAARMRYAWVIVMAGYAPTPAEEMPPEAPNTQQNKDTRVANPPTPRGTVDQMVTQDQLRAIKNLMDLYVWSPAQLTAWFIAEYGLSPRELTQLQGADAIGKIEALIKKDSQQEAPPDTTAEAPADALAPQGQGANPGTFADLYRWAEEFEMTKHDVWAFLGVTDDSQIGDLAEAWRRIKESETKF